MTIKRKRIYEIIIFSLVIILTSLCAYMGITAIQKQMRLKVSFNATPSIYVEVKLAKITNGVTGTFEPIFNNSGTPTLGTGITLTGNKLTITENFTTANSIGASFKLQITNLMSENGLKASFSGTGAAVDTEYVVMKEYSTSNTDDTAEVTVSGNSASSIFEITFEEYYFYSVNTSPASGHFTFSGANEVEQKTEYNATLKAEVGYDLSITVTRKDGTTTTLTQNTHYDWDSATGALTIYASAVTGDITINCTTTLQTFDITFDANDGIFASNSSDVYTIEDVDYNSTYNLPTPPTRANYDFSGWQENGAGDIWDIGTKTCTGATTWVAVWEAQGFTITFSLDNLKAEVGTTDVTSGYTVAQNGGVTIKLSPSTQANLETHSASVPTIPANSCTSYTYDVTTGTLQLNGVKANMQITAEELPWQYYTYESDGAFEGYTYIKFANDSSTEWVIIGSGDNLTSSLFSTSIDGYDSEKGFAQTYDYNGNALIGPNPNPIDKSANGTGTSKELADNQILLLRRQMLTTTSTFDGTNFYAEWASSVVKNYLNVTWTDLNNYKTHMVAPSLYTTCYKNGAGTSTLDDGDDTKIFLLGSRYGFTSSGKLPNVNGEFLSYSGYATQNFLLEDYLGTYLAGTAASNPRIFTYDTATSSCWWLRSSYFGNYYEFVNAYRVNSSGYVDYSYVTYSLGVRPSFILNLA